MKINYTLKQFQFKKCPIKESVYFKQWELHSFRTDMGREPLEWSSLTLVVSKEKYIEQPKDTLIK